METGCDQERGGEAFTEEEPAMGITESKKIKKKKMRVMAAVDDSEGGFYALEWAVEHLRDLMCAEPETGQEGGLLTLVHVQQPYLQYVHPSGGGGGGTWIYASKTVPESVKRESEEKATALFTRAFQICRGKMVKADTLILEGDPKDMICQAVEQMDVDLLVMGSRGLGRIKRAFLGSVGDYCAHHAKRPVLIVKPPKETATRKK